jgi:DNA-binding transcriptional LysR family regulator
MELHQIRYFLAVCEAGGVTRAAELCNVAQPSLTRAVKKLEAELGGPLFLRARSGARLTELGTRMRPYLEESYQALQSAKAEAESFAGLGRTTLRLGVMCTIGPDWLIGLFDRLRRRLAHLEVELVETSGQRLVERMEEGGLDVALIGMPSLPDHFHAEPLFTERYVVAFGPGHRFQEMDVVPMAELDGEDYLRRLNCEFASHMEELGIERPYEGVNTRFSSEREEWIQTLILAGMGISVMPERLPIYPQLRTRPLVEPEVRREVSLVTTAGRRFTPAVEAFVRMARGYDWKAGR